MNKTLSITTIVLVAAVMGMSAIAPAIPNAYAAEGCLPDTAKITWILLTAVGPFANMDRNGDGLVCVAIMFHPDGTELKRGFTDNRF